MFRYRPGLGVSYARQGYIYFASLLYRELPERRREKLRQLCRQTGGAYWEALLEYVTTENSPERICQKHFISRSTLSRAARRYYQAFPKRL